jgi:hypothetical protein
MTPAEFETEIPANDLALDRSATGIGGIKGLMK